MKLTLTSAWDPTFILGYHVYSFLLYITSSLGTTFEDTLITQTKPEHCFPLQGLMNIHFSLLTFMPDCFLNHNNNNNTTAQRPISCGTKHKHSHFHTDKFVKFCDECNFCHDFQLYKTLLWIINRNIELYILCIYSSLKAHNFAQTLTTFMTKIDIVSNFVKQTHKLTSSYYIFIHTKMLLDYCTRFKAVKRK